MFDKLLENYSAQTGSSRMKKAKGKLAALTMPDFLTRRNNDVTVRVFTVDDVNGPRYHDVLAAGDATISPTTPITPTSPNNNGSSGNKTIKPPTITISPSEYLNLPQFSSVPLILEPEPYTADSPTSPNTPPFAKKISSPQKNVPQITLKRRESGYEADLALIESRRSERSVSFSSISTVSSASSSCSTASRPYSPLMHLSASQLFLADDDGRSSMSSSLTSLSGYSTAESQDSGDSGISLKDRRCVSFSDFNAEFNHLEKSRYRWERDNQSATVPSKNRLSSHSFSGASAGGHHHRKHSGSYDEMGLHPHHACVDPLRSSRCRSVSCASINTMASEVEFSGSAFAAKLYNRIGKKTDKSDALRNVSHVCHVYKGTLLLTDILEGKITFMGHNGRTMKEFITESGSEPWCACVTRKGHVAVTLRRQSCVTVWSGHGSLVREFGHDVLKCPTGLACDYKGRFIVTDERTNRVAIFSDTGKFIRYLGYKKTAETDNSSKQGVCGRRRRKAGVVKGPSNSSQHHAENMNEKLEADTVFLTNEEEDSDERNGNNGHGEVNRVLSVILEKSHGTNTADNGNSSSKLKAAPKGSTEDTQQNSSETSTMNSNEEESKPFEFSLPRYVCITSSGKIVVSDSGSHTVKVFSTEGDYLHSIGHHGSRDGHLKVPYGVCCDQQENVYIADHYNDRVSVFTIEGEFIQHALTSSSGLARPKSVAIRGSAHERKLYVSHGGLRASEVVVYKLVSNHNHSVSFKCDV